MADGQRDWMVGSGAAAGAEWWRGAVLYQIYPRSFADADGDGVGDLAGITARLDHAADLGVDGIWLSPVFPSPMRDFGYDVSDHRDIDPLFGTLADFDALVARAHALGLKVVIDQVWSHTALEHPWFAESRQGRDNARADWYVWADAKPDGSPPNNWQAWMGGPAWTWEPRRGQYYLHNFLPQMPDLNFHCPAVQDAVLDVARFWLDRGVDGFRLDTANFYVHDRSLADNPPKPAGPGAYPVLMQRHIHNICQPETPAFLERVRALMDGYGDRMAVAEIGCDDAFTRMVEYTRGRDRLHTAYSFLLLGDRHDPAYVADLMTAWQQGAAADAWPSWALSNHDAVRVATRWGGDDPGPRRSGLLLMLLAALRGTLFLYQGEELGLPQSDIPFDRIQDPYGRAHWPLNKGRDGCRTPMPWLADAPGAGFTNAGREPWLPIDPAHRPLAVDRQRVDPGSPLSLTRRLLDFRRRHPALRRGAMAILHADDTVLLALRPPPPDSPDSRPVLLALNLGAAAADHPLPPDLVPGPDQVRWGEGITFRPGGIHLPPRTGLLTEIRP